MTSRRVGLRRSSASVEPMCLAAYACVARARRKARARVVRSNEAQRAADRERVRAQIAAERARHGEVFELS